MKQHFQNQLEKIESNSFKFNTSTPLGRFLFSDYLYYFLISSESTLTKTSFDITSKDVRILKHNSDSIDKFDDSMHFEFMYNSNIPVFRKVSV